MRRFFARIKPIWKLVVLIFLILLTFSYAMFQGGFVSWFLFYSFLPFALYSLALALYKVKNIELQREFVKTEFNAGEKLKVKIQLKRPSSFPLFYMIMEDRISDELGHSTQKNIAKTFIYPHFRRNLEFEYEIEKLPRGEHHFSGIEIRLGDPLGLIEKQFHFPTEDDKIVVYPSYEDIIYRTMDNHYEQGMTASKERVQRDTSMAIGIREYQPGDRFSWINWKATAKRNDIMTKEFEQRKSHDVFICMDCAPEKRFEAIVSFSASLVRAILRKGAQVGFLSSSEDRVAIPIRSGETHQQQIFYHLAKVKDKCPVKLDLVLEGEGFAAWQNATLILVTAQLTKRLVEKAGYYSSKKGVITIFLIKEEKEAASAEELSLKAEAQARGIQVVMVHDGRFSEAFSGVTRG
ncbi:DUF58 domain-containing protein [Robertmurraya yapensis]|uniref:DUF58 domain-containing protein n=1 Tax=Bacillus yapensis TaxID=2492960 RepID=A0A3S0KCM7_9BACI|nr:DUF58 domain-containing protein [Bacillus yapensis]RTR27626.1 DUF58 domain-containing protein [Bacillus yapensis]TKS94192.1 DUF58 domain-containing protein [Bacillus yapensis]